MKIEQITSRDNQTVRHFVKLQKDRDYRLLSGEYVLEGAKLLNEAVAEHVPIQTVFYLKERHNEINLQALSQINGIRLIETNERVIGWIADTKSPQGIVFSCALPKWEETQIAESGKYIILDSVRDPGNVGTIIRTADAFGISGVILTDDACDPFSPKVARSTMGALFRQPVFVLQRETAVAHMKAARIPIYAAILSERAKHLGSIALKNAAIVVGNEAHGVSQTLIDASEQTVQIPMHGRTESLNAAVSAAIFMWEMMRERG